MVKLKLIAAFSLLSFITVRAQEVYTLEESYDIKQNGVITLSTDDANVKIRETDRNDVNLNVYRKVETIGTSKDEDFEIKVENRDGNLFIRELRKSSTSYFVGYRSTDYRVSLEIPRSLKVIVSEEDGDLDISELSGTLQVHAEDGDISIRNFQGDGISIRIEDGDVEIDNSKGFLSVDSEDGDVETSNCRFSKIDISTEDGDVEIESGIEDNGTYVMKVEDGDVEFKLSGNGARLKLNSEDGSIRIKGNFQSISKDEESQDLEFGNKSANIDIQTEDGDIMVSR